MNWKRSAAIVLGAVLSAAAYAAAPNATAGPVIYQPDFMGEGRIFMVALRVPTGTPDIKVKCPPAVVLLDPCPIGGEVVWPEVIEAAMAPAKSKK